MAAGTFSSCFSKYSSDTGGLVWRGYCNPAGGTAVLTQRAQLRLPFHPGHPVAFCICTLNGNKTTLEVDTFYYLSFEYLKLQLGEFPCTVYTVALLFRYFPGNRLVTGGKRAPRVPACFCKRALGSQWLFSRLAEQDILCEYLCDLTGTLDAQIQCIYIVTTDSSVLKLKCILIYIGLYN